MKQFKSITSLFVMALLTISLTSSVPISKEDPVSNDKTSLLKSMTNKQFLALTPRSWKELSGSKLSFKERMGLRLAQQEIRSEIKNNNLDENATINSLMAVEEGEKSFNFGGFILGFLLGIIGVGLAHIFSKSKNFRRSSWQGFGAWVILILVLALI